MKHLRGKHLPLDMPSKALRVTVEKFYKNAQHTGTWTDVDKFIWVRVQAYDGLDTSGYFVQNLDGSFENFNFRSNRLTSAEREQLLAAVQEFAETYEPEEMW